MTANLHTPETAPAGDIARVGDSPVRSGFDATFAEMRRWARRAVAYLRHSAVLLKSVPKPVTPADVVWVYRMFLGRAPESAAVAAGHASRHDSIESLCHFVMNSPECGARSRKAFAVALIEQGECEVSESDHDTISSFAAYRGPGAEGFVTDFLGTKTRVGFVHGLQAKSGVVEGHPSPVTLHASVTEWAGTLRSVAEARGEFVAVELGAGWGPWLTASAAACRQRGIDRVKLVGVEAAASHVEFLRAHFADNGLDPDAHTLLHGAVAATDGFVEFPELDHPACDYGATLFTGDPLYRHADGQSWTRVPAYSIATLLADYPRVDLIHIDIQGSEAEVVSAARATLKAKARRLVIGTHGRATEQRLLEDLSADGWVCETDEACRYAVGEAGLYLAVDGCQVWRNDTV